MTHINFQTDVSEAEWQETLAAAFDYGTMMIFNFDWLIDRAERGDWGGLWW